MANSSNDVASNNGQDVEILSPVAASEVEQKPTPKVNLFRKICSVLTTWQRVYSIMALLFVVSVWSLEISIIAITNSSSPVDLTLMYTASFCLHYIILGMIAKRAFKLIGFVFLIFLVLAYSIINYLSDQTNDLKLVFLIIVWIVGPVLIVGGIYLSYKFHLSGVIFQYLVGANAHLQSLCKTMLLCFTLMTFDFHMQVNLTLLIAKSGPDDVHSEKIILVFTLIIVLIGNRSIKYENKVLAYLFVIVSIAQPIYNIYILHMAKYQFKIHHIQYFALYVTGGLGFVFWISSVICMYFAMKNFGKGLKEKVHKVTRNNLAL